MGSLAGCTPASGLAVPSGARRGRVLTVVAAPVDVDAAPVVAGELCQGEAGRVGCGGGRGTVSTGDSSCPPQQARGAPQCPQCSQSQLTTRGGLVGAVPAVIVQVTRPGDGDAAAAGAGELVGGAGPGWPGGTDGVLVALVLSGEGGEQPPGLLQGPGVKPKCRHMRDPKPQAAAKVGAGPCETPKPQAVAQHGLSHSSLRTRQGPHLSRWSWTRPRCSRSRCPRRRASGWGCSGCSCT